MHEYQERDGEEDRKPGGKTECKSDMESVVLKEADVLDRTKWKNCVQLGENGAL